MVADRRTLSRSPAVTERWPAGTRRARVLRRDLLVLAQRRAVEGHARSIPLGQHLLATFWRVVCERCHDEGLVAITRQAPTGRQGADRGVLRGRHVCLGKKRGSCVGKTK